MSTDSAETDPTQKRLTATLKLVEVARRLAHAGRLDDVLTQVAQGAAEALDCERATLFLHDEERQELVTRITTELEIREIRHRVDEGIAGWVVRRQKSANIDDPRGDARWISAIDRVTGFHTRNILAVPVVETTNGRVLGVLELLNKRDGPFNEFDVQLAEAFAAHAATALERADWENAARRRDELEFALRLARRIQTQFLPNELPEVAGYELAAWWEPADVVSGDYYDVVQREDGRLTLIVADVSGHGIGPSLLMASLQAMFRVLVRTCADPQRCLQMLELSIQSNLEEGRFITAVLATIDPATHRLTYANAGHGPSWHIAADTGTITPLEATQMPIGFGSAQEEALEAPPRTIAPGDMLLLGTDGLLEVRNSAGEVFGRARLERVLVEHRHLPAARILDRLREAIRHFAADPPPPDDITALVVKRTEDVAHPAEPDTGSR